MRIWNTIFTGLIHEKSGIETDLERAINADNTSADKVIIIGELLDLYVLVELKIEKWAKLKDLYAKAQAEQMASLTQTQEQHDDTNSDSK